jgi:hypothetical protein
MTHTTDRTRSTSDIRPARRVGAVASFLICLAALGIPAAAGAATGPTLEFVAPSTLAPTAGKPTSVFLRNSGSTAARVRLHLLTTEDKAELQPKSALVPPLGVSKLELTIEPEDPGAAQAGELIASAPGSVPAALSYSTPAAKSTQWWVYLLIGGSLLGGFGLVAGRWATIGKPPKDEPHYDLKDRIGPVQWDFSKSWASNLTVVGALLGTIISAGVLPEASATPKSTFAVLSLLFGVLVVLGPFLYAATQRAKSVHRTKTVKEPQYQGYLWSFLLAAAITLWAVFGEVGTSFAILYELRTESSLPQGAVYVIGAVMAGALALVCSSAWYSLRETIVVQRDVKAGRRHQLAVEPNAFAGMDDAEQEAVEPRLRSWSPL